jgi:glycogen debranching enzyme
MDGSRHVKGFDMSISIDDARALLISNDRGGYTVPTAGLYPFQWNWDSAFVAWGFSTFDTDRALAELEALVRGQWDDGLIPHIVFHSESDSYFPGPEVWRTPRKLPRTSGISQPPVFATALRAISDRGADRDRVAALYRAALKNHRWWWSARDPASTGLVSILHPWESGRDNSPAWDDALEQVPQTTVTSIVRRDISHVDASMRPSDAEYRRYIHLVDLYAGLGWDPAKIWSETPFRIADIGLNAILIAAESDLSVLAAQYGSPDERAEIELRRARALSALRSLWSEEVGNFVSLNTLSGEKISIAGSAGYLTLLTDAPSPGQVARMADDVVSAAKRGQTVVASTPPGVPGFDEKRYWRGPVWLVMNWMIARGFDRHGRHDLGELIDRASAKAVSTSGFREYFSPLSGAGLGGETFSWTAAIYLLLQERQRQLAKRVG